MEVNSGQENGKKVMEIVQVAQLTDVPVIGFSVNFRANLYHRENSMVLNPLSSPMLKELLL